MNIYLISRVLQFRNFQNDETIIVACHLDKDQAEKHCAALNADFENFVFPSTGDYPLKYEDFHEYQKEVLSDDFFERYSTNETQCKYHVFPMRLLLAFDKDTFPVDKASIPFEDLMKAHGYIK